MMEEGGRGKTPRSTCVSTLCLRCGPRTPNSQQNAAGVAPSPTAGGRLNCSPPARTAAPRRHVCAWLQRYFSYVARSYPDPWIRTRAPCGEVFRLRGGEHDYEQHSGNYRSRRDHIDRGRNGWCPWRRLFRYRPGGPIGAIGPRMGSSKPALADGRAVDARGATWAGEPAIGDPRASRRQLAP